MSRRSWQSKQIHAPDGPIKDVPFLTNQALAHGAPIHAGERLIVNDSYATHRLHEVEVVCPKLRTVRWIRDAGAIVAVQVAVTTSGSEKG